VTSKLALKWLESNEPLTAGLAQPVYVRNNVAKKPAVDTSKIGGGGGIG